MNVSELKTIVRRYGFDDSDPLLTWLNEGMRIVEDDRRWNFLEKAVTVSLPAFGTLPRASIASNLSKVRWVKAYPDGYDEIKLSFREPVWLDDVFLASEVTSSNPLYWTWMDEELSVYPTPEVDMSLRVRYISFAPSMTSDSSVPGVPEPFHYGVALGAAMTALMAENEEERAQTAQTQLAARLDGLAEKWAARDQDTPTTVTDAMEYFD
jgi:hypothetical protein